MSNLQVQYSSKVSEQSFELLINEDEHLSSLQTAILAMQEKMNAVLTNEIKFEVAGRKAGAQSVSVTPP